VSAEQVRRDPLSNIRAAAALLSEEANGLKVNRADLSDWAPAVARFSGIENAEGQAAYVHKDVYAVLRQGVVVETSAGPVASLMPEQNLAPKFAEPSAITIQSADYAPAIWRPSPNYNARPTGSIGQVGMVIIHSCEGNYSGCWSWLTNSSAQASAHYVVNESGSEISQLVLESNRAWHISATYDCSLNSSVECWRNGYSSNHFTVGIEHGGFASQSSWSAGLLDTSAKLTCDITKQYGIARDRYHIVAHGQLQPATRTDPGPNWPWTDYLNRVNAACGAGTGLVIDSNNNNNDTSRGYIEASANWTSSANVAGYYGSGYYVAPTQAVSDPATFWFYLPAAATKTIDAWWTAASDRSTTTPFIVWNAAGTKLATVSVNQQINGSRWNVIGTYNFSAGWNKVQVSRWTTAGYQVVADAVRVR
jgi:N-acetyl-anhydromuramyl-L-alanine amidase AmpD